MVGYLIRRLFQSLLVLLAVSFVCFAIFQYLGDPILANYNVQELTDQRRDEIEKELGLNRPFPLQYAAWLAKAVQGDFGVSFRSRRSVTEVVIERIPATLELATLSLVFGTLVGLWLGVWSSIRRRSIVAKACSVLSLLGISTPTFLIGLLLILSFSVTWGLLPAFGRGNTVNVFGWRTNFLSLDGWTHLILPVLTMSAFQVGVVLRLTRSGMLEVLSSDYVRTAWSKGLDSASVFLRHALRNALIPVITFLGLSYGELIAFSIVTEQVFQWPGLGMLLLDSVFKNDQPVVVAYILFASTTILLLNLIVDLIYLYIDPRIRYA